MLTALEIKQILKQERLFISKRRGQNFLVDSWVQKKIIQAIEINENDLILEIGPGLGALTESLVQDAESVIAVEKDRGLARTLKNVLSANPNLQIICRDILEVDFKKLTNKKITVVGNLPYCLSSAIVGYLLERQREMIKDIFITVQYEVGKRLIAKGATKDYSSISVLVQYFTKLMY